MCGRYEVHSPVEELAREFDAVLRADPAQLPPRYNIAPSLQVPVVRMRKGVRELAALSWGLLPSWSWASARSARASARSSSVSARPTAWSNASRASRGWEAWSSSRPRSSQPAELCG